MTAAEITAAILALDKAIATGVLRVEYAGSSTTYQSVDAMLKARAHFVSLQNAASAGDAAPSARNRTTYATFDEA